MKISYKFLVFSIASIVLTVTDTVSMAQPPPPPPAGHGLANDSPPGGGAPIGEGVFLLLGFAGLYGVKKLFKLQDKAE